MSDTGSRRRVREYRPGPREQGVRPIQIWVPDDWTPRFAEEAHRQARAVAASERDDDDQGFVDSVSMCLFTTDPTEAPLFRLPIPASPGNGLRDPSRLMVDNLTTVRRSRLGERPGIPDDAEVVRVNRALVAFLGIASSSG